MAEKESSAKIVADDVFLRKMPSSEDAEVAVLGGILLDNSCFDRVLDVLKDVGDFRWKKHQVIYRAMLELHKRSEPVDPLTLADELESKGHLEQIGGRAYLSSITDMVPTAMNVENYARIVNDKSLLRQLIVEATEIIHEAHDLGEKEVDEFLDDAEQRVFRVSERKIQSTYAPIDKILVDAYNMLSARAKKEGMTGIPTGFRRLDELTLGLQPSDLIIVASRPGMGKTSLGLNMAVNAAYETKRPVIVFSLEMTKQQLGIRMMCAEAKVDSKKLVTKKKDVKDYWDRVMKASERLSNLPIYIDDSAMITPLEMRSKARRIRAEEGDLGMVIIDYIQLIKLSDVRGRDNREREIADISRSLKQLAKELDVPVVALAQLNRQVELRPGPDKRPLLADLRESGALEQDADVIIFLYRDEYYTKEQSRLKGIGELIVSKQRNRPTGTVFMTFLREQARFEELADADYQKCMKIVFEGDKMLSIGEEEDAPY